MKELILNNLISWEQKLKEKYGIITDDYFWQNNPLTMGSGLDIHNSIPK